RQRAAAAASGRGQDREAAGSTDARPHAPRRGRTGDSAATEHVGRSAGGAERRRELLGGVERVRARAALLVRSGGAGCRATALGEGGGCTGAGAERRVGAAEVR